MERVARISISIDQDKLTHNGELTIEEGWAVIADGIRSGIAEGASLNANDPALSVVWEGWESDALSANG